MLLEKEMRTIKYLDVISTDSQGPISVPNNQLIATFDYLFD